MDERYKIIDETTWKRALHCQIFRNSIEPSYCVTFELDITNFLAKIRTLKKKCTYVNPQPLEHSTIYEQ